MICRIVDIVNNYLTFGLSWCLFYGVRWRISLTQFTHESLGFLRMAPAVLRNALLMVAIALFLSGVSFMFIFVLDKAPRVKKSIEKLQ